MSAEQYGNYWMLAQQRREILHLAARHDPDLALEMLRSSRPPAPESKSEMPFGETQLERSLEAQLADKDPKRAYQIAKDRLSRGASFEILNVLTRLNNSDPELATQLADDIISKLRSENLSDTPERLQIALSLMRMSIARDEVVPSFPASSSPQSAKASFKLNEHQLRDVLEMVTSTSPADSFNYQYLIMLNQLVPELKKQFPEQAQILQRRILDAKQNLDPRLRKYVEGQAVLETDTEEGLMEAATKSPDNMRDGLYTQAAWKAFYRGDQDRARQIVIDNVRDSNIRKQFLERIETALLQDSIRKENLDEAREKLSHLKSIDQRINTLTQISLLTALKGNRKLALELLNEALPLVNFNPKNAKQLSTLLGVARVYAIIEPARAFEILETVVNRLNELLSAASTLNGFLLPSGTFREDELVFPSGYSYMSSRLRDFGKQLSTLAIVNFDRTKATANKFQRYEARLMAQLFIAQSVLSEQLSPDDDIDPLMNDYRSID